MKVLLYSDHLDKISKSGLGKSIKHQQKALELAGVDYTLDPNDDFDVLHINTYFPKSFILAQKCSLKKIPIVYHAHSTKEDFKNSFLFSNQLAEIFKQWLLACYRLGDVLITPTPYSKSLLESYDLTQEIIPLSNGIDLEKFAPIDNARFKFREKFNLDQNEFVVIGIGLYLERKGILDFVELARRLPHITFLWFGYTDLSLVPAKIKEAVTNPPENCHFVGYVDNSDILLALQGCDVFTFTTLEETEGIPAIEACASKCNFIVRDIPVFDGWLIDQENVYKAKDVDDFEQLLKKFSNHELINLGEKAYEVAVERDLSIIGEQLKLIYQKAINIVNEKKSSNE